MWDASEERVMSFVGTGDGGGASATQHGVGGFNLQAAERHIAAGVVVDHHVDDGAEVVEQESAAVGVGTHGGIDALMAVNDLVLLRCGQGDGDGGACGDVAAGCHQRGGEDGPIGVGAHHVGNLCRGARDGGDGVDGVVDIHLVALVPAGIAVVDIGLGGLVDNRTKGD